MQRGGKCKKVENRMEFGLINRQKDRGTSMVPLCFRSQPSRRFRVRLTLSRPRHSTHKKSVTKNSGLKRRERTEAALFLGMTL